MNLNFPAAAFNPLALGAAAGTGQERLNTRGVAAFATQADISFTTADGDLVSINSSRRSGLAVGSAYQAVSGREGGHLLSNTMALLDQESLSLSVVGDLNEEELADINNLLAELTTIADDFFNGDREKALAGGLALGDMGTISHLQASFMQSSTMVRQTTHQGGVLPALGEVAVGRGDTRALSESAEIFDYHAVLQSQWRQVKEWLEERTAQLGDLRPGPGAERPLPTDNRVVASAEQLPPDTVDSVAANAALPSSEHSLQPASRRMLELVKESMARHPRLSPMAGSIAEMAINRGVERHNVRRPAEGEATSQAANELKDRFNQRLGDWLMS